VIEIPNPFRPEQLADYDQRKARTDANLDESLMHIREMLAKTGGNDHLVAGVINEVIVAGYRAIYPGEVGETVVEATTQLRDMALAAGLRLAKRPAVTREQVREQLVAARWEGAKRRLSGLIDCKVPDDEAGERAWLDREFAAEADDMLARLEQLGLIDPAMPDPEPEIGGQPS
jgi:hypothetical protein